jgi:hypothetical protein
VGIALLPFFVSAQNFGGNASSIKWKQVNTDKVRVIFPNGLDSQANRIANIVLLFNKNTASTIGGKQRKWNIILQNQTTIPNAYVRMAPVMSELFMTPDMDNFSTGSIRWDDNLVIHEDRHIQQFSNFNKGIAKVFSIFLGQEGQLLADGLFIPNYFFEGDAVWQETLVSRQGRGRMPSFYNGFKSLWLENKNYKWVKIRSGSYKDFIPDHYPLGYMMTAYGNATYGTEFWKKVTTDALALKGFNRGIKRYSGKRYQQFYKDAMDFFKRPSLEAAAKPTNLHYITGVQKNNVIDYMFPSFIGKDSILVTKKSYKEPAAFYLVVNGKEKKIRTKDRALNEYYSARNGKIVYAAFRSDPRWGNRNYSIIKLLDIQSRKEKKLTFKTKYFSPDINEAGSEIIAVSSNTDGSNNLVRLDASSGKTIAVIPNEHNYFFTQTKYLNDESVVSAVREPGGKMALVQVNIKNGRTDTLTTFTFNVMGYPFIKGDTVFFSCMNHYADKVFAITLSNGKIFRITNNINGVYHPAVNENGKILVSAFSAMGYRLAEMEPSVSAWEEISMAEFAHTDDLFTPAALEKDSNTNLLYSLKETNNTITRYKKSAHLFSFHSWRPFVDDPEFGYELYSDNVLSSFSNTIRYKYNRSDRSHTIGLSLAYAGLFPVFSINAEHSFDRHMDSVQFNSAKLQAVANIPLSFVGGRSNKYLNFGAGYNIEPFYYKGIGKNVFKNKAIDYMNAFLLFTNQSRQAKQNVNPHWAQTISLSYRDAFNYINSHKLVANSSFYFPGFFTNHSLVINASYQQRDTLPDFFSKTFSYSRGYEALSTRQMYKFGVNYQLPLLYPDFGIANIIFVQRLRANAFYDHTVARARLNGLLTDIKNRSAGAELFVDTKVWNELPVSIGVRFSHLLDTDLFYPHVINRWEIILPINLIPE